MRSTRASLEADATSFAEVAPDGGAVRASLEADAAGVDPPKPPILHRRHIQRHTAGPADHHADMAWTYMLECGDGSYYVGSTRDLDQRAWEHGIGRGSRYTALRQPVRLVWAQEFDNIGEAWQMERKLSGWGRAKRRALVEGRFDDLPGLSARRRRSTDAG